MGCDPRPGRSRPSCGAIRSTALVVVGLSLVVGCASYHTGLEPVLERLSRGDAASALARLERSPREDDALYQLERGLLLRLVGRLGESCAAFDEADRITDDLYTRSVTNEFASLVTNDRVRPYRPAAYERLLSHFYQARNYLELRDMEGALVEARRMERLLDEFQDEWEGEVRVCMPAVTLLAGLLQEAGGHPEDALRLYRRGVLDAGHAAGGTRALPGWLPGRMRRLADAIGLDPELLPPAETGRRLDTEGPFTVVVILEQGFIAPRREVRFDVPILKSEAGKDATSLGPVVGERLVCMRDGRCRYESTEIDYWLSIALPTCDPDRFRPITAEVRVGGQGARLEAAGDLSMEARAQLDRDMPSILARTAVRALLKYAAERQARKAGGEVGGIFANILGAASERAETRTWLTLPAEISMAVVDLQTMSDTVRLEDDGWNADGLEAVRVIWIPGTGFGFASVRRWH